MYKIWLKTCSIILVLTLIVNMLPMAVFGQAYRDVISSIEQVEKVETVETEDARIVKEITENRTEFSKEFQLSNGLRMAAVYADAVHYETENGWEEIDNTLVAKSDGTYANTAGVWDVRFPDQLTKTKGITIEKDGYTLSFFMAGEINSDHAIMSATEPVVAETQPLLVEAISETIMGTTPDTTAETVPETTAPTKATLPILELTPETSAEKLTLSEVRLSQASIEKVDYSEMKESAKHPEIVPEKAHSRLSYSNVFQNTQIIYDLDSNKVKESIVLSAYSQTLRGYRYTLHTGEMIPVLEESGQILFYDKAKENIVMVMPAPYLVDNADVFSYDISVSLTGGSGTYTLTYTLPQAWLADQDRSWPVILDPAVQPSLDVNNILDRTVAEKAEYNYTWPYNFCGYDTDTGIVRFFLKYKKLPAITSSDVVVGATIQLYKSVASNTITPVEVHKVNTDWTPDGIDWDEQPPHNANIEDYALVDAIDWYGWVVTDIVRDWYANSNNGMLFKASSGIENGGTPSYKQFFSSDYGTEGFRPVLTITFRNANGLESYWDYTTSSAGRAGTGYVNNYTGNLVWTRTDMGFGGNLMPVTITSVYNANDAIQPSDDDNNNANNSAGNAFGMGYGWRTNYNQLVYQWSVDGTYYVWEDSDGTDHYFKHSSASTYKDEDGLELTLKTNGSNTRKYSITDKNGNVSYFDTYGRLSEIENNQAKKEPIIIEYSGSSKRIEKITDGAERIYDFVYSGTSLQSIRYLGGNSTVHSTVAYEYTSSNLTKVTFPDNKTVNYTYSNKMLQTAKDVDNYTLTYTYHPISDNSWQPYRVASVTESHNGTGGGLTFAYGHNQTTVTDHNGNVEILQFNDFGNTVCVQDNEGHAQFCEFALNTDREKSENGDVTKRANQMLVSSELQYTSSNLMIDGGMPFADDAMPSNWNECVALQETYVVTSSCYHDTRSLLVDAVGEPCGVYSNAYSLPAGETYTFSCYIKPVSTDVYLMAKSGEDEVLSDVTGAGSSWRRLQVSYTNTTAAAKKVQFYVMGTDVGEFYMDCCQLESGHSASRYNMMNNGEFSYGMYKWSPVNCASSDGTATVSQPAAPQLGKTVLKITGDPQVSKSVEQIVRTIGNAGTAFVFSGWAKGNAAPHHPWENTSNTNTTSAQSPPEREFAIQAVFNYRDGTTSAPFTANFNTDCDEWQYAASAMIAEKAYSSITISLVYAYNVNTAYFDGIQLNKDNFGNCFTYDKDNNVVKIVDANSKETTYKYTENNLTQEIVNGTTEMEYTYDEHHNVTSAKTKENLVYSFVYDEYGNNTSVSITDGTKTMSSTAEYSSDHNRLVSTTDALGKVTTYSYNANTNVLEWVRYPGDSDANKTQYSYDEMFRTASAAATTSANQAMSAQYTYANDQIGSIQTPSTKYNFTYGNFGQRTAVKVGTQTLASYTYTNDRDRYLNRLDYGNGDNVQYTYDNKGRITRETYEDGANVTYAYDEGGYWTSSTDSATGITTTYTYDYAGRLAFYEEKGEGHSFVLQYIYNTKDQLTRIVEHIDGYGRGTRYTYDEDERIKTAKKAHSVKAYTYDAFGRISAVKTSHDETEIFNTTYTFAGTNTTTSGQVATVRNKSAGYDTTYSYTYDDKGNILSVSDGTNTITYTYDSANQLLSEDNPGEDYRYEWTYDAAGNIKTRKEYTYAEGQTSPTLSETVSYTYDGTWGDLLKVYDGKEITYDGIGNPINDGSWTYEWQHGRQLKSMSEITDTGSTGTTWTYTYNADGMRTSRTNGTDTYKYVYAGSELVYMSVNDTPLRFGHAPDGTPMSVVYPGGTYYYVTNLQGDVVAILDEEGSEVVSYTYDAWGNLLSTTGSLADTLGAANPFRYRGYVYDQETELYYLQSRYYNPEWGRFINADRYTTTGQGLIGNNMFAYCNNNPVSYYDPTGHWLAYSMLNKAIWGDGSRQEYDGKSELARKLKKSTSFKTEVDKVIQEYKGTDAQYGIYWGTLNTYAGNTGVDKDLSLSVGAAKYTMTATKETRTTGVLWWKKEQARYNVEVTVYDRYDFTEWRDDGSFGSIMNNAAYLGQLFGYINDYDWEATFTYTTSWE